ncbi:MAG TPA: hypothetical protein VKD71_08155 [Gemmataceae bacterium]|nr:hypothetical protein [Gemmataceae bacterium]
MPELYWFGEDEFGRPTTAAAQRTLNSPRPFLQYERVVPGAAERLGSVSSPIGVGLVNPDKEAINTIASLRSVQYLSLAFDECPDWLPASLTRLTHVTYLRLVLTHSATCPPDLLARLGTLDNLAHLSMVGINVGGQDDLGAFFEMSLASISLQACDGLGMIFNDRLASLPNLRSVSIMHTPLSKRTTSAIARNTSVDTISLRDCQVPADALEELTPLKNLRGLDLEGVALDKESMRQIAKFRCLERLSVRSCGANDAMINLLTNPRLKVLWLSGNPVTNRTVGALTKIRELADLDLACTAVDDTGASQLVRHLNLTRLGLSGTPVTDKAVGVLVEARVQCIDLSDTQISTEGLIKLASASFLRELVVGSAGRSAREISRIRDARPRTDVIFSD